MNALSSASVRQSRKTWRRFRELGPEQRQELILNEVFIDTSDIRAVPLFSPLHLSSAPWPAPAGHTLNAQILSTGKSPGRHRATALTRPLYPRENLRNRIVLLELPLKPLSFQNWRQHSCRHAQRKRSRLPGKWRAACGTTAGERSLVTSTKYKGAVTRSSVSVSFSDSSQSFLTTLPLLIPSIQPHHYGNCLDVSPSVPNLCHPAASDTEAIKPCLIAARLHRSSRIRCFEHCEAGDRSVAVFIKKPGKCPL